MDRSIYRYNVATDFKHGTFAMNLKDGLRRVGDFLKLADEAVHYDPMLEINRRTAQLEQVVRSQQRRLDALAAEVGSSADRGDGNSGSPHFR